MAKKEKIKYNLPFMNKGKDGKSKDFTLSKWTVGKHKECLKELSKYEKEPEKIRNEKWQTILILKGLREVDSSVTEDDLDTLHPNQLSALFAAIYLQGDDGIVAKDFRKGENPDKKE